MSSVNKFLIYLSFYLFWNPFTLADRAIPFSEKALEIYKTAVEMRTVEGFNQVPRLARYLKSEFISGGFAERDVRVLDIDSTAALVVRYRGDGSLGKKAVCISAHMDVVDAHRSDWERDPFRLIEEDGYFFGRGTSDNKLGLTAVTIAFLRLKSEGWVPGRDLIIAFSGDEETSMTSTKALVNQYRHLTESEFVLNADAGGAIIPESGGTPSNFYMQAAEKTYVTWEMTARNPGGHSSLPRSDNAIYDLATALGKIQRFTFPIRYNDITLEYFKKTGQQMKGEIGKVMQTFASDPYDEKSSGILRMSPRLSGMLSTTCVATMLRAGHAENALPQSATATINCRVFPGSGIDATLEQLKVVIDNPNIEFKMLDQPTESNASPRNLDVIKALRVAVDTKYPDLEIISVMSSYGTDGMHFRAAGIPSYGVSANYGKASDDFAHGLNERVLVETFYDNLTHWYVMLRAVAGKY